MHVRTGLTKGPDRGWVFFALGPVAMVTLGFLGSFLLTSDAAMLLGVVQPALEFLISPWMIAVDLLSAGFLACGLLLLRQFRRRAADDARSTLQRQGMLLVLLFSVFALGLVTIGALFARDQYWTARSQALGSLQNISRLRAQQVDKWLFERSRETAMLGASLAQYPLDKWQTSREVRAAVELLVFEVLAKNEDQTNVRLLSPGGEELLVLGRDMPVWTPPAATGDGLQTETAVVIDSFVRVEGQSLSAAVSFTQPLANPADGRPLGTLRMTIDPVPTVARLARAWPTPTATGEIMLLTRNGGNAVALTPSRFDDAGPLRLITRPLARTDLPAVAALVQGDGLREGLDYRGATVLSSSTRVQGVPWHVFAKIDRAEAFAPLDRKYLILALTIGVALAAAGTMVWVVWRGQRASLLALEAHNAREHRALTDHYRSLVETARDSVLLTDAEGAIVEANRAAVAAYGYSLDELQGTMLADLQAGPPSAPDAHGTVEILQRRKDGTTFPAEVTSRELAILGGSYRQSFVRDISARKTLEMKLARLSQVKQALQGATSALLRASSAAEAMQAMCTVLVDVGHYRLVHVAVANADEARTIRFVALAGDDGGYLSQARISWGEGPRAQGPTGIALRTGELRVNQNFDVDPAMAPWRDEASRLGFHSSAAFPIVVKSKVFAALTLYAALPDAFDEEEVALLTTLANDLAWTIARLDTQES